MKTVNSVLSVVLSACIIMSAVVFVSADMHSVRYKKSSDYKTASVFEADSEESDTATDYIFGRSDIKNNVSFDETETESRFAHNVSADVASGDGNGEKFENNEEMPFVDKKSETGAGELASYTLGSEINAIFDYEYSDTIYSVGSHKDYIYKADGRGAVTCKITHDGLSAGGFIVRLYMRYSPNGDGAEYAWRLINELETTSEGKTYKSALIGIAAGTYKAVVSCLNDSVPDKSYTLELSFTDGTDFETEYNDTVTRYNEIIPGKSVRGSASYFSDGKDYDWYMFRVYEDGAVTFTFDHEVKNLATVCWKITVFDSDGNEIYSDNSYFSTATRRSGRIGVEKGCYYICVENRVYYDATYTLTLRRYTELPYESEYNDTRDRADVITPGVLVTGELSSRSSGSDIDWFKFTLTQSGVCTFSFEHKADDDEIKNVLDGQAPKNGWRMTVMSESGAAVYSAVSSWDETGKLSPLVGLAAGTYYIKVDSADLYHNSTPYTVDVSYDSSNSWEHEPNGTYQTADALTPFVPIYASLSSFEADYDTDWFSFTVDKTSRVSVELGHDAGFDGSNIFMFGIYDSSLNRVALTDENGNALLGSGGRPVYSVSSFRNTKSVYAYGTLEPGTYYVKVVPGLYYDSMRFSITLTVSEVNK